MGLLKKLFVEEIPNETESYDVEATTYEEPEVEVELDDVNTDTLIEDIYVQNELYDKTKSIFKVEELINSLPKEMVTETKKTSVLAILGSFGLTVTDVIIDGDNRYTYGIDFYKGDYVSVIDTKFNRIFNLQISSVEKSISQGVEYFDITFGRDKMTTKKLLL